MTDEKQARIKALRTKLASLSTDDRQKLASRGIVDTVEGRQLSVHNTILLYLQSNGNTPTIVGGYQQWKRAGKQVKRGEHGYIIWFPVGNKEDDSIEVTKFYTTTVFDIAQTEAISTAAVTPKVERVEDDTIMSGFQLV